MTRLKSVVCRDADPELFAPLPGDEATIVQAIEWCRRCSFTVECLQQGIDLRDWDTIRGGLTGDERRRHHRAGLKIAEYPPHRTPMRRCLNCLSEFRFDPACATARLCESCRPKPRRAGQRKYPHGCVDCGQAKEIVAHGMCDTCYRRCRRAGHKALAGVAA